MFLHPSTIKHVILMAALFGSLVLFTGAYVVVTLVYNRTVQEEARNVSELLADHTFDAMYQVIRKGWKRAELDAFVDAIREHYRDTPSTLDIYRGPKVESLFGSIQQPPIDAVVRQVFSSGEREVSENQEGLRHVYPLLARNECLRCHVNSRVGDVLGVIDLHQNLRPVIARARANFISTLWLIVPLMFLGALFVALLIQRRIDTALDSLRQCITKVNKVSDLAHVTIETDQIGLSELDEVLSEVRALAEKLRTFAIDKELLEFEIRLLERFIITSDVVQDWHEYTHNLLREINKVMDVYILFSVFKVEEDQFDLEIFWYHDPTLHMLQALERSVRAVLQRHPHLNGAMVNVSVNHHVAEPGQDMPALRETDIELQSKSLFVDKPEIGGIVGIGVQAGLGKDPIRLLVMESILSTLLNVVGSVKAISKYTKEIEHSATRDPLTNLYNHHVFRELLEYEVGRAERKGERLGLLVIDLDNFKNVNDSYGHTFGDRFLQEFSSLLKMIFRQGDIVCRYGGDEFVVLLNDTPENSAYAAATRLVEATSALSLIANDDKSVHATISVGVALYPNHAKQAHDLFLVADNMMYRAKAEGKDRIRIASDGDISEMYRDIGSQSIAIMAALEQRKFASFFQPIIGVERGEHHGMEVLSRLESEDGKLLDASQFIETAERMGVVNKLDYQVMEGAFEAVRLSGFSGTLFFNLSPKALILSEFVHTVARLVNVYGIDPETVVFELTERETVRNLTLLKSFVKELKQHGFKFAIDNFGSGYSSFHYLKQFPIDYVKIDGEFIINMIHDERDRLFVHHVNALAQELGIKTIAEFVENEEIYREVQTIGINYAQGYFLGRPGPDPV